MALVFYAVDGIGADRGARRLVLVASSWDELVQSDRAPYLTVLDRDDAAEEHRDAIEGARADAPEEAAALARFLRAAGGRYVAWELDDGATAGEAPVTAPAVVLGTAAAPDEDGDYPAETGWSCGGGDGDAVALARGDGGVEIWDLGAGRRLATIRPLGDVDDDGAIDGLALDRDRGLVAVTARYGATRGVWRLDGGAAWVDDRDNGNQNQIRFTPSGAVVWWSMDALEIIEASTGMVSSLLARDDVRDRLGLIVALAVDAEGRRALVAHNHGHLRLVTLTDPPSVQVLPQPPRLAGRIAHLRFVAGDRALLIEDDTIERIDLASGRVERIPLDATDEEDLVHDVRCVAVAPGGGVVALGGCLRDDEQAIGTLWLWACDQTSPPRLLGAAGDRHAGVVLDVAFSRDGRRVVSLDRYAVRIWDTLTGAPVAVLAASAADLAGIHVTAARVWAWSDDGAIYGWELP